VVHAKRVTGPHFLPRQHIQQGSTGNATILYEKQSGDNRYRFDIVHNGAGHETLDGSVGDDRLISDPSSAWQAATRPAGPGERNLPSPIWQFNF
jgi:hypothetical protein